METEESSPMSIDGSNANANPETETNISKSKAMNIDVNMTNVNNMSVSEEDEARQAIDKLRGEDLSERIAAANKLDGIAKVLGEERTREVSQSCLVK